MKKDGYFVSYLNCNDDAFRAATATLARIPKSAVVEWIAAQDAVFSDCSAGAAIPPPATDPSMRSERAYQIASAHFYAEQYDEARRDFQSIASDTSSPWHDMAPYLAARCLISRPRSSLKPPPPCSRWRPIRARPRWHAPAQRLLDYVRIRTSPTVRMHELALALVKPGPAAGFEQDLTDYRMLFDKDVKPQPSDDLTDWILSFQAGGAGALDKWRQNRSLPWLIAALQSAKTATPPFPSSSPPPTL